MTDLKFAPASNERSLLWLLAAIQLTLLLDFMILMPLGPQLMRELQVSPARFGGLVSCYTLASAMVGFSGAFWIDRFPRKALLLVLYAGFLVASLACAWAPSATWLLVARIIAGACAGVLWAVVIALVVDVVPPQRRGSAIGLVMTSYAMSAVGGVPLGLFLASRFGWRAPFLLVTAVAGVLWLASVRLVPQVTVAAEPRAASRAWAFERRLMWGWVLTFWVVFAGFLLIPYLATFMSENLGIPSSHLGWVYLCGGMATFFTSRKVGDWVDARGPVRILALLLCASAVPHLLFTHLGNVGLIPVIAAFILFMTLTSGRIIPTMALITERVPGHQRGRFLAVNTAMSDVASALAAWLSGALLTSAPNGELIGFGRVGYLAVGATCAALCVLWVLARSAKTLGTVETQAPLEPTNATPHVSEGLAQI